MIFGINVVEIPECELSVNFALSYFLVSLSSFLLYFRGKLINFGALDILFCFQLVSLQLFSFLLSYVVNSGGRGRKRGIRTANGGVAKQHDRKTGIFFIEQ